MQTSSLSILLHGVINYLYDYVNLPIIAPSFACQEDSS